MFGCSGTVDDEGRLWVDLPWPPARHMNVPFPSYRRHMNVPFPSYRRSSPLPLSEHDVVHVNYTFQNVIFTLRCGWLRCSSLHLTFPS